MRLESESQSPDTKRHTGAWVGFGVLLALVALFLLKVGYTYLQILRGDVEIPANFSGLTVDSRLAVLPSPTDSALTNIATFDDPDIGNSKNPVLTIVEFADFGCPYSKKASYIPRLLSSFTDRVRFVYRDFPIAELHPTAALASEAGECAQEQKRFFDYADKVFRNQNDLSDVALRRYATEIGLDAASFNSCLDSHRYSAEVEADRTDGVNAGVTGTPTFFFNGQKIQGAIPQKIFEQILTKFLSSAS